jgi:hypothetical protein
MDEHFVKLFISICGAKTAKATLWPSFHKALFQCRIYNRANGLQVDRSTFFQFATNAQLKDLVQGKDARYEVRKLSKQEWGALWKF